MDRSDRSIVSTPRSKMSMTYHGSFYEKTVVYRTPADLGANDYVRVHCHGHRALTLSYSVNCWLGDLSNDVIGCQGS